MGSAGLHGNAVECVLATVGEHYSDATGGDAEFNGEYGTELPTEYERKLHVDGLSDCVCGAVCGSDDHIRFGYVGGCVDVVAVPVEAGSSE